MKIGELAVQTGVSVRSLRYYESQGLITPIRQANGYRTYSPLAVETVGTIKLYLNLGLSTEQIAGFLHEQEQSDSGQEADTRLSPTCTCP